MAAIAGAGCLLIAGCSGGGPSRPAVAKTGAAEASAAKASAARAAPAITPASGSENVTPQSGVTVTSAGGRIRGVRVTTPDGVPVSGSKFVTPSSLPPPTASVPLQTAAPHSARAA